MQQFDEGKVDELSIEHVIPSKLGGSDITLRPPLRLV